LVKQEYNHSTSPALLNALEHAYHEWHDKAVAFAGYGTAGRGTDQPRHHCRRRHRSTDQRHHCCGHRHHRRRRRRGRSRVGLRGSGSSGGLHLDLIMTNRALFGGDEPAHLTVTNRSQGRWPERWSSATPTPPSAPERVSSTPTHPHPTGRDGHPATAVPPPPRRSSDCCGTRPAAPRGATHRSGTSSRSATAGPPAWTMGKDCAKRAT